MVEVKAVGELLAVHEAQLLTYLKLANISIGLLINFNVPVLKRGIKRLAYGNAVPHPGIQREAVQTVP